ncbi:dimethylallyl tryptophan synthase [Trichoderma arundinaceum]|uniref:Dimethylallyl tryptophan synthase n=1 Tax=Trichoderma arundinaceum TaxID=490622 RepID=A0A395NFM6_TRIAR|nr:dimethylallyl tryptophan synthase [Trichoderma arundinaceum]
MSNANETLNASHREVYTILSDVFDFPNEDQRLWWHSTAPMFAEMLETANYDVHAQYRHLHTFKKYVIPFLGVYPTNDRERWRSILTRYGIPFELSLNCSDSVVRYTFEPINATTGTIADPFNTHAIWENLQELMNTQESIDLEYFQHFKQHLTLNAQESTFLYETLTAKTDIMTQNKLALDLKGNKFLVKTYIYPALKALVTGKTTGELIFDSIRKLAAEHPNISPSLSILDEYVKSRGPNSTIDPRLLSCDLLDSSKSRIKIYISEQTVSFAAMQDLWTLGGRRRDPSTLAGLDMIQELWLLLRIPPGFRSYPKGYLPLRSSPDELLPSMANYTLLPNHELPEPQLYFAVFGMNDMAITNALTTFFERHGWSHMAKKYKDSLKAC